MALLTTEGTTANTTVATKQQTLPMMRAGITNKTNQKHELVILMHKRHKKLLLHRARVKDVST